MNQLVRASSLQNDCQVMNMDGMGLNPANDNIVYIYLCICRDMYTQKWILIDICTDVTKC